MAVNLGRERPTPPHVSPNSPAAQNMRQQVSNSLQRLRYSASRLGNQAARHGGYDPSAKTRYNRDR